MTDEKAAPIRTSRWLRERSLPLLIIVSGAFLFRLCVRLFYGEEYFWKHSYSLFYDMAKSIALGQGLCYEWMGTKCAHRPPVYPVFLFLSLHSGGHFITIVVLQSLIGAGTSLCAYKLAEKLFDKQTGLLAALGVAIYPYFVMHDTALQETGLFTFFTAVAVLYLFKSKSSIRKSTLIIAGIALGLAVLTRATLVPFVPLAFLWLLLLGGVNIQAGFKKALIVAAAFLIVVAPWIARNYVVVGKPTFSTLTGLTLWAGNNPYTLARYPMESIDRSADEAFLKLRPDETAKLAELSVNEVAQDAWFANKALEYIRSHPGETLVRSVRKVGAAFSWRQNPPPGKFAKLAYFLSYSPILILGLIGAWLSRKSWREHSLIYALFLSFIVVTAVFFGHTSHRSYLDVYLIVFSANAVSQFWIYFRRRAAPQRVPEFEPAAG